MDTYNLIYRKNNNNKDYLVTFIMENVVGFITRKTNGKRKNQELLGFSLKDYL